MAQIVSTISNIGYYDAYVIELSSGPRFNDEIYCALDENFGPMGEVLGENQVYVREYGTEVSEFFFDHLGIGPYDLDLPALLILDKHPNQLDENDKCIVLELGEFNSKREVTRTMELIRRHLQDGDFMTSLTWEQRKRQLSQALEAISTPGQIIISVLSVV